ncbi:glucose-6-phosphate isomerase [Aureococcus anophagefferens]|nr:glucose-6-phosphate isomerase [Aureococcus anophagefferens]
MLRSCSSQSPTRASRQFGNAPRRCAAAPTRPGTPCARTSPRTSSTHLRDLLRDDARNAALTFAVGDITLDCSRQRDAAHTAARARGAAPVLVDGADVHAAIHDTLDRVYAFAGKVRGGVGATETVDA